MIAGLLYVPKTMRHFLFTCIVFIGVVVVVGMFGLFFSRCLLLLNVTKLKENIICIFNLAEQSVCFRAPD